MVELIWDGKYDSDGKRAAPLRVKLPFQTVETVNESAQQRQRSLDFMLSGRDAEWRNRLIWGDKKYVLPSLLAEFAGKVDLIYIDPPFATGQDFSFQATVGDESFTKEASIIEQKAYRDTWGTGLDGYLKWLCEAGIVLHELLSELGSLYLHCDPTAGHYIKLVLDEIFGINCFRSEVVWGYRTQGVSKRWWPHKHDTVFLYTKSGNWTFHPQMERQFYQKAFRHTQVDSKGRHYVDTYLRDVWDHDNTRPTISQSLERTGYTTQKPEALLERIIRASSNEGDLVLDCFCGSGTTSAVAEKLNRRWIACDLGRFAIHTTRKRLLAIDNVRPFVVQNLGKYERQHWQKAEFGADAARITRDYRKFILDLYHAEVVEGYAWLHGRKGGRMAHVGSVDAPVAEGDVRQIAIEFKRAQGSGGKAPTTAGVDVLGWDFALDANETMKQIADSAGIDLRFLRIPREVLEKKAVDQGDIRFFELAALSVNWRCVGREVFIGLTDFIAPHFDVPQDVREAVREWSDWIDYWAVDWDYRGDAFHNQWQSYRTRQDRSLSLQARHDYAAAGEYTILVKAIDMLGNDTTKTLRVSVA